MSSKLVKQQLQALNTTQKPAVSKKNNKRKKNKKQLEEALETTVVQSNLAYFKRTKGPSSTTQELISKVLEKKGFKQGTGAAEEDDFDDLGLDDF